MGSFLNLNRSKAFIVIFTLAAKTLGCGHAFSDEDLDEFYTLASFNWQITNPQELQQDLPVRAALLWKLPQPAGKQLFIVGVDQRIHPQKEGKTIFSMKVEKAPKPEARYKNQEGYFAKGTLIVYHDRNDNGKLDRLEVGSDHSIDTLLSVNNKLAIWLFDMKRLPDLLPPDRYAGAFHYGFNTLMCDAPMFPDLDCQKGRWEVPEKSPRYGRPDFQGIKLSIDSNLAHGGCGASEDFSTYGPCAVHREEWQKLLQEECSLDEKKCPKGKVDMNLPVTIFTQKHADLYSRLTKDACCFTQPDKTPWICNPGHAGCPRGYDCCDGICTKDCKNPDRWGWVNVAPGAFMMGPTPNSSCQDKGPGQAVALTQAYSIL